MTRESQKRGRTTKLILLQYNIANLQQHILLTFECMIRKIGNFQQMYTPELTLNGKKIGNSFLASYIEHLVLYGCH